MKFISMLSAAVILGFSAYADNEVECTYTNISSDITSNTTLSASTLYRLTTCIRVTDGHTLTIPAGTTILAAPGAALIVEKGAVINAQGTAMNPIVFTSDKQPTFKNYGDWDGIYLLGKANNNQSNSITIDNRGCSVTGGGTINNDNSGTMQHVRIEYTQYGLTMISVGSGTTIDHIQVSYSANDGFQFLGGKVNVSYLTTLNVKGTDFLYEYGIQNQNQYLLSVRTDSTAHYSSSVPSYGVVMANNENSGGSYSGSPLTHPVISNSTFLGPRHCTSPVNNLFAAGVLIKNNSEAGFYNNVISGWNTGLVIDGNETITNVLTDHSVNVTYNSFINYGTDYSVTNGTWPSTGVCATSITNWMRNTGVGTTCGQPGNQFPSFTLGYSGTLCGDYSSTRPVFTSSGSGLSSPNYDAPELSGMDEADDRGAINAATDWTTSWTEWDPFNFDPCPQLRMAPTSVNNLTNALDRITIAPNPSDGLAYVSFNATQDGNVTITLTNSVGQVVRTVQQSTSAGSQKIAVRTDGLSTGMYMVNVDLGKGATAHIRLVVK